jgi:hypothetical protein
MNARKKKSPHPVDKVSADQPPDRITELERRVLQLEKDVALLKSLSGSPFFNEVATEPTRQKPGIKPRLSDEELLGYRDGLILWLEPVWPWLAERLAATRNVEHVAALLEAIADDDPEQRPPFQQRLLHNAAALFAFLFDEKYRKTELAKSRVTEALNWPWEDEKPGGAANQLPTRQIANAMAGVPDIAWSTSRDRCAKKPSEIRVAFNRDLYYRDKYGLPASEEGIWVGMHSPVPKPCRTISARPSAPSSEQHRARQ